MNLDLSKAKIFLLGCIFFILGVAMASFTPPDYLRFDLWLFAVLTAGVVAAVFLWSKKRSRLIIILVLFFILGFWRYSVALPSGAPDKIWNYNNQTAVVIGVVNKDPDEREKSVRLEIKTKEIILKGEQNGKKNPSPKKKVDGKLLITVGLYPEYDYGDKLEIEGKLQAPKKIQDFAYDRYLARYDVYSVSYYPKISLIEREGGNFFYKKIYALKAKIKAIIAESLSEPESSLAGAIIIGEKRGLSSELRDLFSQAGLSHLVAISGLHIGIISVLVMAFLLGAGLGRKPAFYVSVIFLFFYLLLIGLPPSAMRAGLMGFLVLWALNSGRLNKLGNSIFFAAAGLLFFNPKLLRDDIGFQLSFLAVLGIAFFYPWLENFCEKIKIPSLKGVRSVFLITVSAQIFTLPVVIYNFSVFSLVAPAANLLVLWSLPFLLVLLMAAIFLSFLRPDFSLVFFLPAGVFLKYIVFVAEKLTAIPFSYLKIDYLWLGWLVFYYGFLLLLIRRFNRKKISQGGFDFK